MYLYCDRSIIFDDCSDSYWIFNFEHFRTFTFWSELNIQKFKCLNKICSGMMHISKIKMLKHFNRGFLPGYFF